MASHKVPEPYVWDESFQTFYARVDNDHIVLFEAIFDVHNQPNSDSAVGHMEGVMAAHFNNEEKMMSAADYGGLAEHKKQHDHFMNVINEIRTPVHVGEITFCKEWLVNHIKNTDFKYKGLLLEN
uniref:Hemerythrin n=1 Tax=Magelona berkeleyi TaxID=1490213 RepID=A0A1S6QCM4_9ANNE|nr:hemerythrin [Magelona berkeleyi]